MSDRFTANKLAWIDQVVADAELGHLAARVGVLIASHLNRASLQAWPSQQLLADRVGATVKGVRGAVRELIDQGHLRVLNAGGGGRGRVTRYALVMDEKRGTDLPLSAAQIGEQIAAISPVNDNEKGNETTQQRGTERPTNPMNEPIDREFSLVGSPSATRSEHPSFAAWYAAYPRKEGRKKAAELFSGIVSRGEANVDELIAGATAYADSARDPNIRFTKLATTWLNGGHWSDEHQGHSPSPGHGFSGLEHALRSIAS